MGELVTELLIIGGGAAGVAAAIRARQLGAQVILVEKDRIGGTCMHRGCIPTRCLMEAAHLLWRTKRLDQMGIEIEGARLNWDRLMSRKEDLVRTLEMGTEGVLKAKGVQVIRGIASFASPDVISVGPDTVKARSIILATGSTWEELSIPGGALPGVVTTDWLLNMRTPPPSVTIFGSGPVELEASQYLRFLGSAVTILEPSSRIMPQEEREMARRMASILKEQGVSIVTQAFLLCLEEGPEGLRAICEVKGKERVFESTVFLHTMRRPALEGLELQRAGLREGKGALETDDHLRTFSPNILAAGDVTGRPFYSHRASHMGLLASENALGIARAFEATKVPRVYYTVPQYASVGLTEAQAKEAGWDVISATIPYSINAKAMITMDVEGAVKIVSDKKYGEVLGVHILGPQATELISEGTLAMELEATVGELAEIVRSHPTLSESMAEAARECLGRALYLI